MTEIALHLLDMLENSAKAGATSVRVFLEEDDEEGNLVLEVRDDGRGMSAGEVSRALEPFFTTAPGKRAGMGLALLRGSAEAAGGGVSIRSSPGKGTVVRATFKMRSVDRPPVGDVPGTIEAFLACHPGMDLDFTWKTRSGTFRLTTRDGIPPGETDWLDRVTCFAGKLAKGLKDAGFEPDKGGFEIEVETRS
jgi:anti-sigma regulatory factor (Ser/Thr protein kinase)